MADLDLDPNLDDVHLIRLRRGWELDRPGEGPSRVDLPGRWPAEAPGPRRLVRRFGRPPRIDPRRPARLVVEGCPGLRSIELNGRGIAPAVGPIGGRLVADLGPLEPRNALALEVDGDEALAAGLDAWGVVALAIPAEG